MKSIAFIILLNLFAVQLVCCQQFTNWTTTNGLASNEVYSSFQDSKGYMWFATSSGVSRFDGNEFESFDVGNGLPGNTIFGFFEDSKKNLWFRTFNGKIGCFNIETEQFTSVDFEPTASRSHILAIDEKDCKLQFIFESTHIVEVTTCQNNQVTSRNDEQHFIDVKTFQRIINHSSDTLSLFKKDLKRINGWSKHISNAGKFQHFTLGDKKFFFSGNSLFTTDNQFNILQHYKLPKKDYTGVFPIQKYHDRVFLLFNDTVKSLNLSSGEESYEWHIPNVSHIFSDKDNGIWITSLTNGIFYCRNNEIKRHDRIGIRSIAHITPNKGYMYFAVDRSELGVLADEEFELLQLSGEIQHISPLNDDEVLVATPYSYLFNEGSLKDSLYRRYYVKTQGEYWGIINGSALESISMNNLKKEVNHYEDEVNGEKYREIFKVNGQLWITKLLGFDVFDLSERKFKNLEIQEALSSYRISKVVVFGDLVLVATRGGGVFLIKGNQLIQYEETEGLIDNVIFDCFIDSNMVWVCSPGGVAAIPLEISESGEVFLNCSASQQYKIENGLPVDYIQSIACYKERIYLGTSVGLFSFPKNYVPTSVKPTLLFAQMEVASKQYRNTNELVFPYTSGMIQIEVKGIHFPSYSNISYKYRSMGTSEWQVSKSNKIQFLDLDPGTYEFEIICTTQTGASQSDPLYISFEVIPPIYQTWWFRLIIMLLLIMGVGYIISLRIRSIKRKKALQFEMQKLEGMAARAQLNPHFIFNALNSIQNYVGNNSSEEAERYLSKFSRLIRWVLEDNEKDLVTLAKEIEFLNYYIPLEQMRLKHKFEYEIHIDPSVDCKQNLLPPFVIQPYVENAIWHGLQPSDRKGVLYLSFQMQNDELTLTIEDNGVGISDKEVITKSNSMGIKITEKRLKLFEQIHKKRIKTTIKPSHQFDTGTMVVIKIVNHA